MSVKRFKPTTPSLRHTTVLSREDIDKKKEPLKSLTKRIPKSLGRNNQGRITSRFRGGGYTKKYRIIDFKRSKDSVPAIVKSIEYDSNRTSNIALLSYKDGEYSYILSPLGLKKGDVVISSSSADIRPGNAKKIKDIPVGTLLHNVELHPGSGGQIARAAGSYVQLMAKETKDALIRMPSGELRKVKVDCFASIGQVGNLDHEKESLGKAGKSRHKGIRPRVRGVAMNPIDHPHGGGEGRTSGGRHPVTPWGKGTKGLKTRHNKRTNSLIVKRRK
jgi:large subunit ribosomal protein L2